MIDREKVVTDNAVRGLQSAIEISGALVHLRKEHAKAILALLKEQSQIVMCKDCKFFTTNKFDAEGYGNCRKDVVWRSVTTEWFCADGVRKDS